MKKLKLILKILFYIVAISPIIVIFYPEAYRFFWKQAYNLLIFIMFIRPVRDIFHIRFLTKIVSIRKELWIIVWTFGIAHSLWYFIAYNKPLSLMFNPNIWYLQSWLAWWILAFFISFPLMLTSNYFSLRKLWKNWKKLHFLAYLMFIFVILHKALVNPREFSDQMFILALYLFVLFLAFILKNKKIFKNIWQKQLEL